MRCSGLRARFELAPLSKGATYGFAADPESSNAETSGCDPDATVSTRGGRYKG
jgi:hypothetical protein